MSTPHVTRAVAAILLLGLALLPGCAHYDVTVNERIVYTPVPLFKDFVVDDPALAACLAQTIEDQQITGVSQLRNLRCSSAGIASLTGLERFSALERLDLSSNRVADITALTALSSLRELYLRDNQLATAAPLMDLRQLDTLDLVGNTRLDCPTRNQLGHIDTLQLPRHCTD